MLNAEAFDGLDLAAKGCRRDNARPFGGVQLLVAGDFFQLPPVSGESTAAAAAALVIVVAVVVAVCSIEMEGVLFVGTTIRPRIPRKNTIYF